MEKIINASPEERQYIFQAVAAALHIAPEMVEKDFWVCRILQKLFQEEELRKILRFKGGTSLSKVFSAFCFQSAVMHVPLEILH